MKQTEFFNINQYRDDKLFIDNEGNPDITVTEEQVLHVWKLLHYVPKISVVKIMKMTDLTQQTIYNIKDKKYFPNLLNN